MHRPKRPIRRVPSAVGRQPVKVTVQPPAPTSRGRCLYSGLLSLGLDVDAIAKITGSPFTAVNFFQY